MDITSESSLTVATLRNENALVAAHRYKPKDYHLESLVEDKHFFVLSPKDIVVGKPRDADDRVDWLLQHEHFAEALAEAEGNRRALRRHAVVAVGRRYLDALLLEGRFLEAGQLCVRIFGVNKDLWQEEVFKFARQDSNTNCSQCWQMIQKKDQIQAEK